LAFSRIQREVSLTQGEGQTSDFNRHPGHPEAQTARARDVNQNLGLDARIESEPLVRLHARNAPAFFCPNPLLERGVSSLGLK